MTNEQPSPQTMASRKYHLGLAKRLDRFELSLETVIAVLPLVLDQPIRLPQTSELKDEQVSR